MKQVEEKLKILRELYQSDFLRPFPYQDCRKILLAEDNEFIPSLDMYFSDIAGYCSWGKGILSWSAEKIDEAKNRLQISFFQKFPKFESLKSKISDTETPKLYNQMLIYELMRLTLIDILSEIERAKKITPKPELSLAS